ncbi:MAG: InlB B-repeat-containing protein [Acutalibacteraceae bacterium]
MKKALSLLLSVLMIFSCMTVAVFAENETPDPAVYYTIKFVDWDGTVLQSEPVAAGEVVAAPANPTRASEDKNVEYVFKGWSADGGNTIYHAGTIPIATGDATYTAIYAENKKSDNLTFWQLVQSIFARINKIFEYFYEIFGRNNPYL